MPDKNGREKGAVLVLFALLLPLFFVFIGVALELGNGYYQKAKLQKATDAAALAGALLWVDEAKLREPPINYDPNTVMLLTPNSSDDLSKPEKDLKNTFLEMNGLSRDSTEVRTSDYVTGSRDPYLYQVTAKKTLPLLFLRMVYDKEIPISATSTARIESPDLKTK